MGPTYRPEEIILVQHEPDQALGPQIEDLLIKLYERVVDADAGA
jgi:hypothetical protein